MKKVFFALAGTLVIGLLGIVFLPARAQENTLGSTPLTTFWQWSSEEETTPTQPEKEIDGQKIYQAIQEIKKLLQEQVDSQELDPNYKPRVVTSRNIPLELVLGLWNYEKNEFDLVRVIKNDQTITPINTSNYKFKLLRNNGVNSVIEVTNRRDLMVLGLIHPVFADISDGKQTKFKLENVVYIPYSTKFDHPILVQAGKNYLNNKVQAVYQELEQLKITSRARPRELITKVIDQATVKTIIAIEHVEASVLLNNSADSYLRRFYATLAANEHRSYAYARSQSSARGLVQFIPSTYHNLRKIRPDLTLHPDFVQGMTDPYNAIKAQIGLLDYNLTLLPKETREKYVADNYNLGALMAAMYNGGPTRVRRAIKNWGEAWDKYHGNISSSLRSETAYYVAKFRLVYKHFYDSSLHLAGYQTGL